MCCPDNNYIVIVNKSATCERSAQIGDAPAERDWHTKKRYSSNFDFSINGDLCWELVRGIRPRLKPGENYQWHFLRRLSSIAFTLRFNYPVTGCRVLAALFITVRATLASATR